MLFRSAPTKVGRKVVAQSPKKMDVAIAIILIGRLFPKIAVTKTIMMIPMRVKRMVCWGCLPFKITFSNKSRPKAVPIAWNCELDVDMAAASKESMKI